MADYSGAYENFDYVPPKKNIQKDHIHIAKEDTGLATGGVVNITTPQQWFPVHESKIARRSTKTRKTFDDEGRLIIEEIEEVIDYVPSEAG